MTREEHVQLVRRGFMAAMDEDWPTGAPDARPCAAEIRDFDIPDAASIGGTSFLAWLKGWGEAGSAGAWTTLSSGRWAKLR